MTYIVWRLASSEVLNRSAMDKITCYLSGWGSTISGASLNAAWGLYKRVGLWSLTLSAKLCKFNRQSYTCQGVWGGWELARPPVPLAAAPTQLPDWNQQVWLQPHSFFPLPPSWAAPAMKTPPRGPAAFASCAFVQWKAALRSQGRVARVDPPTAVTDWPRRRCPPAAAWARGQWWPEAGGPPCQVLWSSGPAREARRGGARPGTGRGRGGRDRTGDPSRGAGAGGLLRWLSPAPSCGFPGRAPDGGRGRGRSPGWGRVGAQLLLFQPGLHVSRDAAPAREVGDRVSAPRAVVLSATCGLRLEAASAGGPVAASDALGSCYPLTPAVGFAPPHPTPSVLWEPEGWARGESREFAKGVVGQRGLRNLGGAGRLESQWPKWVSGEERRWPNKKMRKERKLQGLCSWGPGRWEYWKNFPICPWASQRGIWAGPQAKRQPIPAARPAPAPSPAQDIVPARSGWKKPLDFFGCFHIAHPARQDLLLGVQDSFPGRRLLSLQETGAPPCCFWVDV